jgi:hypothetical protein
LLLLFGDELFWTVKCGGQGWHKVNFYLGKWPGNFSRLFGEMTYQIITVV